MDTGQARLVLDLRSGKMELEGSEEFVVVQSGRLAPLLAAGAGSTFSPSDLEGIHRLATTPTGVIQEGNVAGDQLMRTTVLRPPVEEAGDAAEQTPPESEAGSVLPESFDVWLERMRRGRPSAKDVERVLWAGYHIQLRSQDNAFTASQVVALLRQYGVNVKYPSQAIHQNWRTGKVTRVRRGRFRLTPEGIARITRQFAA